MYMNQGEINQRITFSNTWINRNDATFMNNLQQNCVVIIKSNSFLVCNFLMDKSNSKKLLL